MQAFGSYRKPDWNPATTVFAFRGYNTTNLGRTAELYQVAAYRPTLKRYLQVAENICSDVVQREVDLVSRVKNNEETSLGSYDEAVALIFAVELAQVQLLQELFGYTYTETQFSFGYSLGELAALTCAGVFDLESILRIPISLAKASVELSRDVTMGVLFSRGAAIDEEDVIRLCTQISSEGKGTIGISTILSPNTLLLLGQRETILRFRKTMHNVLHGRVHMRINPNQWPPLHTPIVWQRQIVDRASVMIEGLAGGFSPPCPPVYSIVTGGFSYDDIHTRSVLRKWVDHPQRVWEAVYETLKSGTERIIHVGPQPNVIPATYHRLAENVRQQTTGNALDNLGMRAVSGMAHRPWLAALLPSRASLLKAPSLEHIVLEDWLLENAPQNASS